ncbi:SDR family oxidoreductase [Methylocapsa sp. S129]|uniref:SDR family oxidoreductase n=1 Tax=Methylocapsa sp. S129 TaxID=1641869 RepID=UPI001AEF2677|nr:SDR family oxidoreductase [Methylocapsa sp. S129]
MASGMVIVTGGGRGIGAAACLKLAAAGYSVAVNYAVDEAAAQATVAAIQKLGGRAQAFGADVADPAAVRSLFESAVSALGPLTGLINNAGIIGVAARIDAQEPADLARLFAVNVMGTILCAKEAVRRLSTRHGGHGGAIVNISSVAARLGGLAGGVPYAMTKGAIETFTKGLANEVAREGIRVNAVAPGMTATDMSSKEMRDAALASLPMGRVGAAEEIAEGIIWLMSPAAAYATGTVLTISGGR